MKGLTPEKRAEALGIALCRLYVAILQPGVEAKGRALKDLRKATSDARRVLYRTGYAHPGQRKEAAR